MNKAQQVSSLDNREYFPDPSVESLDRLDRLTFSTGSRIGKSLPYRSDLRSEYWLEMQRIVCAEVAGFQRGSTHGSGTARHCRRSCWRGEDEVLEIRFASGSGPRRSSVGLEALFAVCRGLRLGIREFAKAGELPLRATSLLEVHVKPAAKAANLEGQIGWHTYRHTYSSMLRELGVDVKVQQELLRHADIRTTMNLSTQAVSEQKRAAHSKGCKWCWCHRRKTQEWTDWTLLDVRDSIRHVFPVG